MAGRAGLTLIAVTAERLARADFAARAPRTLLGTWTAPRPAGDDLPTAVERAVHLAAGCGRQVWVLAEDLWTQTLSLPAASTADLPAEQLTQALAFEAEPLSGQPALGSAAAARRVEVAEGLNSFWFTQTTQALRDQVADVLARRGGRLAGLLHPGGLPAPLSPAVPGASWRRVECWRTVSVCVRGGGGQLPLVRVIHASATQANGRGQLGRWLEATPAEHHEWLGPVPSADDPLLDAQPWEPCALTTPTELGSWLQSWAHVLAAEDAGVPVIAPAIRAPSPRRFVLAGAAAASVVLGLALWHGQAQQAEHARLQARIHHAGEPARQATALDQQSQQWTQELAQLRKQNAQQAERVRRTAGELAVQVGRLGALLEQVQRRRPDDLAVLKIGTGRGGGVAIEGVCLQASDADEFAARLADGLRGRGWTVQAAEKTGQRLDDSGGPWSFTVQVSALTAGTGLAAPTVAVSAANSDAESRP